ncbi:MAG: virulence protein RhuM/Fic/DOC family protein [Candidatus Paceibacterota bacterium]|jgi:death-on-curing family protein
MIKAKEKLNRGEIVIYKDKGNKIDLEVKLEKETVWLDANQIALLFGVNRPAIVKHVNNIYKGEELNSDSTCSILEQVAVDGKKRKMNLYNLDMIISVGYRVNSKKATSFRIWATNKIKDYLVKGYVVNQKILKKGKIENIKELEQVFISTKRLLEEKELDKDEVEGILRVITDYTNSWVLLQKYDEGKLTTPSKSKKVKGDIDFDLAEKAIIELKRDLVKKEEASDLFGKQRGEMLQGILGNLCQSISGKELYPNVEVRAANLLYFVIKDHPFFDGNKRIASFLFILFLRKNDYFRKKNGENKIDENGLVALALLVAKSDFKDKDGIIKLIINFLSN